MNRSDTMTDAIALSSPSGRMSKRARKAATDRLAVALFGPDSGFAGFRHEPSPEEQRQMRIVQLQSRLADLRHFAAVQPRRRVWPREIAKVEAELAALAEVCS